MNVQNFDFSRIGGIGIPLVNFTKLSEPSLDQKLTDEINDLIGGLMNSQSSLKLLPNATLFGFDGKTNPGQILQGLISDCFVIAPLSSIAKNSATIQSLFKTPKDPNNYRFNFYMKGNYFPIEIDDNVPVFQEPGQVELLMA